MTTLLICSLLANVILLVALVLKIADCQAGEGYISTLETRLQVVMHSRNKNFDQLEKLEEQTRKTAEAVKRMAEQFNKDLLFLLEHKDGCPTTCNTTPVVTNEGEEI